MECHKELITISARCLKFKALDLLVRAGHQKAMRVIINNPVQGDE